MRPPPSTAVNRVYATLRRFARWAHDQLGDAFGEHSLPSWGVKMLVVEEPDLAVPLEWFPSLRDATAKQRDNWEMIGGGYGMHWPELDEDLSVFGLLNPQYGARKTG